MKYATREPIRDRKYLDYLRTQPCLLTGVTGGDYEGVDPMHIGTRGKGLKSADDEAIPVIHHLHSRGHHLGEISMLREHAPDSVLRAAFRALARELYKHWKEGR